MFLKTIASKLKYFGSEKIHIPGNGDLSVFRRIFPSNKKTVIVQTHSDDALIHSGITASIIAKLSARAELVTVVSDDAGVTDEYALNYLRANNNFRVSLNGAKRHIRYMEAEQNALEIGFKKRHENFDFSWPVIKPVYENGRLISARTEYQLPTKKEFARICAFVADAQANMYIMATPFSRHQQHRQSTELFLQAIHEYSRQSKILFWSDVQDKTASGIQDNLIVYYSDQQEGENIERIIRSNDSQNTRRGGNGRYYADMAQDIAGHICKLNPLPSYKRQYHYAEGFTVARFQ